MFDTNKHKHKRIRITKKKKKFSTSNVMRIFSILCCLPSTVIYRPYFSSNIGFYLYDDGIVVPKKKKSKFLKKTRISESFALNLVYSLSFVFFIIIILDHLDMRTLIILGTFGILKEWMNRFCQNRFILYIYTDVFEKYPRIFSIHTHTVR